MVKEGAAAMVADRECLDKAVGEALRLLSDEKALQAMSANLERLARPQAAEDIVDEILKLIE